MIGGKARLMAAGRYAPCRRLCFFCAVNYDCCLLVLSLVFANFAPLKHFINGKSNGRETTYFAAP